MKFYSKYTNLTLLLKGGKKVRFEKGVYDATKEEAKEIEQAPSFGTAIWKETPKKKKK
jgi:hypothetical protein